MNANQQPKPLQPEWCITTRNRHCQKWALPPCLWLACPFSTYHTEHPMNDGGTMFILIMAPGRAGLKPLLHPAQLYKEIHIVPSLFCHPLCCLQTSYGNIGTLQPSSCCLLVEKRFMIFYCSHLNLLHCLVLWFSDWLRFMSCIGFW